MSQERDTGGYLLLAGGVIVVIAVYLVLVPQRVVSGELSQAIGYLVVGWVPYTLVFYALGRLFSSPEKLPNMRAADTGLGLFLVSLLISLGLDTVGISPERFPEGHAVQMIGIFVGLALFGWGVGRRSRAIDDVELNA